MTRQSLSDFIPIHRSIDAPPFWSYLGSNNHKAAIIDAPDIPLIPGLPGIQLANWDTHDSWAPEYYVTAAEPAELLPEIHRKFGTKLAALEKHQSTPEEDKQIHLQLLKNIEKKGALCRYLMSRDSFGLVVILFSEIHAATHQFWKYRPGQGKNETGDHGLSDGIRNVYQAVDRQMGLLLEKLPPESNVFVVSSVGMEDSYPTDGLIEDFLRKLDYQKPSESKGASLSPMEIARKIIPEPWRVAMSRHLKRESRERLLAAQFLRGTKWSETTAFAIPSAYTSFVRVNLRGREPEGVIEPGAEYMALLDRIESDLKQLIDPDTREPVIAQILKTTEVFKCAPHDSLPDLFVKWKPGRFLQRAVHPKAELVQKTPEFFRPSDHSCFGFVAASGPSIQKRETLGTVAVLDLVPTFLSLMKLPIPRQISGQPIEAMLTSDQKHQEAPDS